MNKSAVSLLLLVGTAPAWAADSAVPPPDRLTACTAIQDAAQRLRCFDQQMAPAPTTPAVQVAEPGATKPPAAKTRPAESATKASPEFGEDQLSKKPEGAAAPAAVLHARIADLKAGSASSYLVYLDNGQVWRHEDSVQGAFLNEGEPITITRGSFGSYRLTRDSGVAKNWIRVTRIK